MAIEIETAFQTALAYHHAGKVEAAEALYRLVLAGERGHANSCNNLGVLLKQQGRLDEAEQLYRLAIDTGSDDPATRYNYGLLLEARGKLDEARGLYQGIVDRWPDYSGAVNNLAVLLTKMGDAEGAVALLDRSVAAAAKPDLGIWLNLAATLRSLNRLDEALEHLHRLVAAAPDWAMGWAELAMAAFEACDYGMIARVRAEIDRVTAEGHLAGVTELVALTNIHYVSVMEGTSPAAAARAAAEITRRLGTNGPRGQVRAAGPLRIGYLSKNFGNHAIGHVSRSLYRNHDRDRFRIHAYSTGDRSGDGGPYHADIRAGCDAFCEAGINPTEIAARIRDDGIDILVDLDGHMSPPGIQVMALRPAPIQVFWLGVAGSPGLPYHDYLIADRVVVPDGEHGRYPGAVVRLPDCYHPADRHEIDPNPPSRADEGLPEDALVLCVFNNPQKYDQRILDCWMGLLAQVPQAVLWLSHPRLSAKVIANLRAEAERRGVDGGRLFFARLEPDKGRHLRRHELADLFLDTVTLTASTTALDVLWMGLPMVTCPGNTWPSRIAASFLTCMGLPEYITGDLDTYRDLILALCRDEALRQAARTKFGQQRTASPLFDIERFTGNLEAAYLGMAARARAGQAPAGFDV